MAETSGRRKDPKVQALPQNFRDSMEQLLENIRRRSPESQSKLKAGIENYTESTKILHNLVEQTYKSANDVIKNVGSKYNFFSEETYRELIQLLEKPPVVMVTGSSNAGKSTLINEIIRDPHDEKLSLQLPVSENPCTVRITKIVYGEEKKMYLLSEKGERLPETEIGYEFGDKKSCEKFEKLIAFKERDDHSKGKQVVVVQYPHPLFKAGLIIVDSPGTGEKSYLDRMVQEFLQQHTVICILYVWNGKRKLTMQPDKDNIVFLRKNAAYSKMIYVVNRIEQEENGDAGSDSDEDENQTVDAPFPIPGKHEEPKKLIAENKGLLKKWYLLDDKDDLVGLSAFASRKIRIFQASDNHTELLMENFYNLEEVMEKCFNECSRSVIDKVVDMLFFIQQRYINVLSQLCGHISYARSINDNLLAKYKDYENELFDILKNVMKDFPSHATEVMTNFKEEKLAGKAKEFGKEYKAKPIDQSVVNTITQKSLIDFVNHMKSLNLKVDNPAILYIAQFLRDFADILVLMCSQKFNRTYNQFVGNEALNRAQKLFEILRNLSSFNQSDILKVIDIQENQGNTDFKVARAERAIRMIQMALSTMLGTVGKNAASVFEANINSQLKKFFKDNLQFIKDVEGTFRKSEKSQIELAKMFVDSLNFLDICHEIQDNADHSLAAGHGSNLLLLEQINDTIKSGFENKVAESLIDDNYRPAFGSLMVETRSRQFQAHYVPLLMESSPEQMKLLRRGRKATIMSTCLRKSTEMDEPIPLCVRCVERDSVASHRWTKICIDLINSWDIKNSAQATNYQFATEADSKTSEDARYGAENLLHVKFWFHQPSPERLLVFTDLAQCSLLEYLSQENRSLSQRMKLARDVLRGLRCHHNQKYTHDDLRPEVVVVSMDSVAKINLCKAEEPFRPLRLADKSEWRAFHIHPEMYKSYPTIAQYYDLYALGSMFWIILEGSGVKYPSVYQGVTSNEDLASLIKSSPPVYPERLNDVPEMCSQLMESLWSCCVMDGPGGYAELFPKAENVLTECINNF